MAPCVVAHELPQLVVGLHAGARHFLFGEELVLLELIAHPRTNLMPATTGVEIFAAVVAALVEVMD